jgi:hypothetical protein
LQLRRAARAAYFSEVHIRAGRLVLLIWLIIGAIAAGQRGYYGSSPASCTGAGTTIATTAAGPLNYVGVNPKVSCHLPSPSS